MSIGTRLFTWLKGELVGTDRFGNRYYCEKGGVKARANGRRARRWVVYDGQVEASRVPPDWHGWLHHSTDAVPPAEPRSRYPWEREHIPNMTGTNLAYRPPGHELEGGARARATGDYEPWRPS